MTRLILCAGLALAACSSEPQRNASAPAPAPGPVGTPTMPAAPQVARGDSDSGAKPQPGALKTFGDWTVGCDNTNRCELRSLAPETGEPGEVTVSVAREPGPAGKVELTLDGHEDSELNTVVDGHVTGSPLATLAAMASGHALAARAAGRTVATVSLKGVAAALRYADAAQGRAGTVTALIAKGLKPARAVPAARPAPVIAALASKEGEAAQPTPVQLAAMRKAAACDDQSDKPEFHPLGGGKTLVLLPCSSGAYNVSEALLVLDGSGFAPARTDAPVGFAETGADVPKVPSVVNGEWKDGVLTSHAKGRGIGDCGVDQDLVWDGTRLRLSEQREMGECRGNPDFIRTWRAEVMRR